MNWRPPANPLGLACGQLEVGSCDCDTRAIYWGALQDVVFPDDDGRTFQIVDESGQSHGIPLHRAGEIHDSCSTSANGVHLNLLGSDKSDISKFKNLRRRQGIHSDLLTSSDISSHPNI